MKLFLWLGILAPTLGVSAHAQWGTKWLQDETYWGDGKAEFNIYEAREIREGQPRPSYVVHIYGRESFAPNDLVKADDAKQPGTYPVLKFNQILYIPTGIYTYQQMHSGYWKTESGQLIKASLTSSDSIGNTYKEFRPIAGWRSWLRGGWNYHWHTYWQHMSEGTEAIRAEKDATFYDELPMRVRSIDFTAGKGAFAVPLAPSIINSKKDKISFDPVTVEWKQRSYEPEQAGGKPVLGQITVTVKPRTGQEEDVFLLDPQPPHLLREWRKRDGGILKLKRSLKTDYWNHNKLGDQEKLLPPENSSIPEDQHEHDKDE
ncbi:hypothetical protein ACXR0O_17270 [Verrucomicrobiota bacterium sgz303538]